MRDGESYRVPVEFQGKHEDRKPVAHARMEVVLGNRLPDSGGPGAAVEELPPFDRTIRSIYHELLFHGPALHALERVEGCGAGGINGLSRTAPAPSDWLETPLRQSWLSDPLAIDSAFQLVILWSLDRTGSPSLPTRIGRYRQFQRTFPTTKVRIRARVSLPSPHRATAEIVFVDLDGSVVARIDDYECVVDPLLIPAFRRNKLPRVVASSR
ncbi:MAG: hypothetical protein NVSMB9_36840 [Isosphaeraceae bacterium]